MISPATTKRSPRALASLGLLLSLAACASTGQATFRTPEAAVRSLADMLRARDLDQAEALFGPDGVALIRSGDDVADREDGLAVLAAIEEHVAFEPHGVEVVVAVLGHDGWPFPFPLVNGKGGWRFDVEAGRQEVQHRRVGRNELMTLDTLHAYVDAQREYRASGSSGDPPAYAARILSSPGARDGLYWPTKEGEAESPLGPLVAAAAREGYEAGAGDAAPFHGYHYRSLTAQGEHAPGGARSYLDDAGRLTGGFALLAWPAKYGVSGVMTFVVNQQGIVFEKDLGAGTQTLAEAITTYDPDRSWEPTAD